MRTPTRWRSYLRVRCDAHRTAHVAHRREPDRVQSDECAQLDDVVGTWSGIKIGSTERADVNR